MKNYTDPSNPSCQTRQDRDSALQVAEYLGIRTFVIFDFRQQYHQSIIDYIINSYQSGLTPNPDILCNSQIKFKLFLDHALRLGCDYIATGHYAKIIRSNDESDWLLCKLYRATDHHKDQTYFLSWLDQYQLSHSLFPLWGLSKVHVRKIAKEIGLPNAERPESQWVCFVGNVPMRKFLRKYLPDQPGNIVNIDGEVIGQHCWIHHYTIGQRHGLGLNIQSYVIAIDHVHNEIVVWSYDSSERLCDGCVLDIPHWIGKQYDLPLVCHAKIRYRQDPILVYIIQSETKLICRFNISQTGVAPGQTLVCYNDEECIMSATILHTL